MSHVMMSRFQDVRMSGCQDVGVSWCHGVMVSWCQDVRISIELMDFLNNPDGRTDKLIDGLFTSRKSINLLIDGLSTSKKSISPGLDGRIWLGLEMLSHLKMYPGLYAPGTRGHADLGVCTQTN